MTDKKKLKIENSTDNKKPKKKQYPMEAEKKEHEASVNKAAHQMLRTKHKADKKKK